MADGRSFGAGGGCGSNLATLLLNQRVPCASDPFFVSGSSPSFLGVGSRSMMSFEAVHGGNSRMSRSFLHPFDEEANGDGDFDEHFHQPSKKRRLTVEQVKFLEKSFEVENKLELERKVELAKDLGLQPRQVAIWFQNRRARWKGKQLEKDYDDLQASYNRLKADYDILQLEKDKLKAEVLLLTDKVLLDEKEKGNSELSDTNKVSQELSQNPVDSVSLGEVKQEEFSSSKSDIFDSDDGGYSSHIETCDASYLFEPDQSDLSQDEEDNFNQNILPPYIFPKLEDASYSPSSTNSCNFGFPVEENAFWSWSY